MYLLTYNYDTITSNRSDTHKMEPSILLIVKCNTRVTIGSFDNSDICKCSRLFATALGLHNLRNIFVENRYQLSI